MGRELAVPFAVDDFGGIAYTSDPVQQLTDHVTIIVGTQVNERLMRPTYGVGLNNHLFSDNDDAEQAVLEDSIRTSIQDYEPLVTVTSVTFDAQPAEGYLGIQVGFVVNSDESQTERTASVQTDGTVVESLG